MVKKLNIKIKQTGFTMIELMITIAIAAILLAIAVPSFRTMIQNNRITTHSNNFLSSLVVARSEAIKRNNQVRITAVTPVAANEWGNGGWRIWVDENGNNTFDAASDTLIRQVASISNTFVIDADTNNVTEVRFQANGFASAFDTLGNAKTTDTFLVKIAIDCPGTTNKAIKGRIIDISSTGRASSVTCSCDSSASNPC